MLTKENATLFIQGDEEVRKVIFMQFGAAIRRTIKAYLHSDKLATELIEEVFFTMFRNHKKFRDGPQIEERLFKVALKLTKERLHLISESNAKSKLVRQYKT